MRMRKCLFEDQIDDYLLNRLEGETKDRFEEHYFNCSSCFAQLKERNDVVSAVKTKGAWLFAQDREPERKTWVRAAERLTSFLTPRQWVTAAVAAGVILFAVFGALPLMRQQGPQFVLSDSEVVRGQSLTLISPLIDVKSVPAYFEWAKLAQATEYKIFVYNGQLLWSTTTIGNKIAVPDNIKQQMGAGQKYSWQVRAFSAKGTLVAVSSRVQFQVVSGN
jgi:ribosomal protein L24E